MKTGDTFESNSTTYRVEDAISVCKGCAANINDGDQLCQLMPSCLRNSSSDDKSHIFVLDEKPEGRGFIVFSFFALLAIIVTLLMFLCTSCSKNDDECFNTNIAPDDIVLTATPTFTLTKESALTNLIFNGGGDNQYDWRGDSLAIGWSKDYPRIEHTSRCEIRSGNPFSGRSQYISNLGQFALYSPEIKTTNAVHTLSFLYRSTVQVRVLIRYSKKCGFTLLLLEPCDKPQMIRRSFYSDVKQVMWYNAPIAGELTLDQVNLY
jgi:hypothetical protein